MLSVVTALLFGGIVIILTDFENLVPDRERTRSAAIAGAIGGVLQRLWRDARRRVRRPATDRHALQTGDPSRHRDRHPARSPRRSSSRTPLIFVGLAVAISFRAGMFNIGGDGQLHDRRARRDAPAFILAGPGPGIRDPDPGAIVAGALGGAFWGFIPGFLKARTGAHEVITTIMLNYIASAGRLLRPALGRRCGSPAAPRRCRRTCQPFVDVPAAHPLAGDPPRLRLHRRPAHGRASSRGCCSGRRRASSSGRPAST